MRIKRKILLLFILITAISLIFSGCYDLGDAAQDDEEYCDLFPDIIFVDRNSDTTSYDMEDFYNKEAVNDFKTPMDESDRSEYTYILIKIDKDVSLGEVSVFFDSTIEETLSVSFFILDEDKIPTKIYTGAGGKYLLSESDEPDDELMVAKASCRLEGVEGKWTSLYLRKWGVGEDQRKGIQAKEDQYLVLRLDNNCYDLAQRRVDLAKEAFDKASQEYDQKLIAWQVINGSPLSSQEQKIAATDALSQALQDKNVAEKDYEAAQKANSNKVVLKNVSVRVTAILIYAD